MSNKYSSTMKVRILAIALCLQAAHTQAAVLQLGMFQAWCMDQSVMGNLIEAKDNTTDWFKTAEGCLSYKKDIELEDGSQVQMFTPSLHNNGQELYYFSSPLPGEWKRYMTPQDTFPSVYSNKYSRKVYGKDVWCRLHDYREDEVNKLFRMECQVRDNQFTSSTQ